jgi:hypothetical protein
VKGMSRCGSGEDKSVEVTVEAVESESRKQKEQSEFYSEGHEMRVGREGEKRRKVMSEHNLSKKAEVQKTGQSGFMPVKSEAVGGVCPFPVIDQ